jgi:hypothetical protein
MYDQSHGAKNNNAATNHYVTIVGMGKDEQGKVYFSYYDNYADPTLYPTSEEREEKATNIEENRFFWNPNGYFYDSTNLPIEGPNHEQSPQNYIITEIRPNIE